MKHILQMKIHAKIYKQIICEKNSQTIRIYCSVDVWMDKNLGKCKKKSLYHQPKPYFIKKLL
jgi:hypothetical protein